MRPQSSLEAQLRSAGRLLGLDVAVTESETWELTATRVTVGLGYFRVRGITDADAAVLALRDFWAGIRSPRLAPGRAHRRAVLSERCPELDPLLTVIERAQAGAELCAAMPGLRGRLRDATLRGVPEDLRDRPIEQQWNGALLRLSAGAESVRVDDPVAAELARLLGGHPTRESEVPADVVRRVLGGEPGRSPVEQLDRALAVLVPPLQRLRAQLGRGLADRGDRAALGPETPLADGAELGLGDSSGAGASELDAGELNSGDAGSITNADVPSPDEAPAAGAQRTTAQFDPAALTEIQSEVPPTTLIELPLPARDAIGGGELPEGITATAGDIAPGAAGSGLGRERGVEDASLSEYRARAERLRPEIARVREVWRAVLAHGLRHRRVFSRLPATEGVAIFPERLATTVTEVRAGIARPAAFRTRALRARDGDAWGSVDALLVLDRSASMRGPVSEACADAGLVMLESLGAVARDIARLEQQHAITVGASVRAGVMVFDEAPRVIAPLRRSVDEGTRAVLHTAVRSASGRTDTAAALRAAAVELGAPLGRAAEHARSRGRLPRRLVILIGDGDCDDPAELQRVVGEMRARGLELVGIGIGSAPGMAALGDGVRRITGVSELPGALAEALAGVPRGRAHARS